MSSTEFNIGLSDNRSSSRVMKPPVSLLISKWKAKSDIRRKSITSEREKSEKKKICASDDLISLVSRVYSISRFYLMFPLCPSRAALLPTFSPQPTHSVLTFVPSTISKTRQISTSAWIPLTRTWRSSNSLLHQSNVKQHQLPNRNSKHQQVMVSTTRWTVTFRKRQRSQLLPCRNIIIIAQPLSGNYTNNQHREDQKLRFDTR